MAYKMSYSKSNLDHFANSKTFRNFSITFLDILESFMGIEQILTKKKYFPKNQDF